MSYPTQKLVPEIKAEWVRRLRSGEYAQTTSHLKTSAGYCCLGVLCTLAEEKGVLSAPVKTGYDDTGAILYGYRVSLDDDADIEHYDETALPPTEVVLWAFDIPEGTTNGNEWGADNHSLTNYNDEERWDFNQIADEVEAHW